MPMITLMTPDVLTWLRAALMTCELESSMRLIMSTLDSQDPLHERPLVRSEMQSPQRAFAHDLHNPIAGTSRWLKQFIYSSFFHSNVTVEAEATLGRR